MHTCVREAASLYRTWLSATQGRNEDREQAHTHITTSTLECTCTAQFTRGCLTPLLSCLLNTHTHTHLHTHTHTHTHTSSILYNSCNPLLLGCGFSEHKHTRAHTHTHTRTHAHTHTSPIPYNSCSPPSVCCELAEHTHTHTHTHTHAHTQGFHPL